MINIPFVAYKLLSPNEDGRHEEEYGFAATLKLAKEWVAAGGRWPRRYMKVKINLKIAETLEEVSRSGVDL